MCIASTLFIDNLISEIRLLDVTEFPFDNTSFYDGVAKLHEFFLENISLMGEYGSQIEPIFEKNVFVNYYPEIRKTISKLDGTLLEIMDDKARIAIDRSAAIKIMEFSDIGFSQEISKKLAEAFLEGMNLFALA